MAEKWAVVTGASGGIGLEMAKLLAKRSYNLVLVARSKDKLEEIKQQLSHADLKVRICSLDLAEAGSAEALVRQTDQWGLVPEVLINNAGVGAFGHFLESDLKDALAMIDLNVSTLVKLSHLYGQKMLAKKRGFMLQVASTAAYQPLPSYAVYAASKSFVLSFSRAFNYEARQHGVSSTALCPGPTSTGFFANAHHTLNKSFEMMLMQPDDVAQQGLNAMFAREEYHVAGLLNKVSAFLPRLLPAGIVVRSAAFLMR